MERNHHIPTERNLSPEHDLCDEVFCPSCYAEAEDHSTWHETKYVCPKCGPIDWSRHLDYVD